MVRTQRGEEDRRTRPTVQLAGLRHCCTPCKPTRVCAFATCSSSLWLCAAVCVWQHPSVVDLDSALSMTFSPHDVSGATAASTSRGVTQRLAVEGLPPVLVLQLKRFTIAGTGGQRKVAKHIAYDQRLTFPRKCCAAMLHAQPNQYCKLLCMACTCIGRTLTRCGCVCGCVLPGPVAYHLRAVVVHHGTSLAGGHYTCYVRHPTAGGSSRWLHANDTSIVQVCWVVGEWGVLVCWR